MIQIRRNIFETNSSSVHSMTMCTEATWLKWEKGLLVHDNMEERFRTKEEFYDEFKDEEEYIEENFRFSFSPEEFDNKCYNYGYETFRQSFNGVIAFGYFGHD